MPTKGVKRTPSVLIVDDYRDTIEMYAAYLHLAGFRPLKASNGHEALRIARAEVPDVILMDLGMPGIDGFEVTRRLKTDPRTQHIPVIALTAHATPEQFETVLALGFDDVILKPCFPDVLADQVQRVVNSKSESRERETSPATQPAA